MAAFTRSENSWILQGCYNKTLSFVTKHIHLP